MRSGGRVVGRCGALALALLTVACTADTEPAAGGRSPSATATASSPSPAAAIPPFPDPPDDQLPAGTRRRLDRALRDNVTAGASLGVTAAVVSDAGTWVGAEGKAPDGRPLAPRSSLLVASVTKTFTAAEVVLLADRGLVDLDAPASSYVRLPVPDNDATVRQLLAMRSGIRDFVGGPQTIAAEQQPDRHWTPDEALEDVPDQTDKAGALFEYSNSNYLLLGQLIEEVTDGSYSAALHRDLLAGPALAEIAVQDEERPQAPLARAPADIAGAEPYLPSRSLASLAWAAGGIAGRAESVARWGYLLYGGHILDPELVATMLPREDGSGYGYGTEKLGSVIPGIEYVGHRGDFGPYRSALAVTRDRPLSIAVLLTRRNETADPMNVVEALTEILVR